MPRIGQSYWVTQGNATTHVQATSTGTADIKTTTPPVDAVACFVSVETTDARVTVDGSAPSSTNGIVIPKGVAPVFLPLGMTLKHASTAAAACILNICWLA